MTSIFFSCDSNGRLRERGGAPGFTLVSAWRVMHRLTVMSNFLFAFIGTLPFLLQLCTIYFYINNSNHSLNSSLEASAFTIRTVICI